MSRLLIVSYEDRLSLTPFVQILDGILEYVHVVAGLTQEDVTSVAKDSPDSR